MNLIQTPSRYAKAGLASSLLVAIACTATVGSANALTPEQRALVAKYNISAADQQKLFGGQPATTPARSGKTVKAAPVTTPVAAPVVAPVLPPPPVFAGIPVISTTYVWLAADNFKSIGDRLTNINGGTGSLTGSFGGVGGFNSGFALGESTFGVQGGMSYGTYDFKGRLRIVPNDVEREKHEFYTIGAYRRGDMSTGSFIDRFSGGVVYDSFTAKQWGINANDIKLTQLRYTAGFAIIPSTEVGVWGTKHLDTDRAAITVAGAPNVRTQIQAMTQTNLYVKHNFDFGGTVSAYYGWLSKDDIARSQVGVSGQIPLSASWAAFANANYVTPRTAAGPTGSGQEQFSTSIGIAFYFGGNAASATVSGNKGLPMLDVASTRTFLISD